jgi:hypothetical protein
MKEKPFSPLRGRGLGVGGTPPISPPRVGYFPLESKRLGPRLRGEHGVWG